MIVVDDLDEWLDLAALGLTSLRHPAGDLRRVALNTSHQSVGEWVCLGSSVERLDYDNLIRSIRFA